jgi:D-serine deaminase-like pyridoxal phosphate-dependent protein
MKFQLSRLGNRPYRLETPEDIATPRLILFEDRIQANIRQMRALLAAQHLDLSFQNLCPHVKTHKSAYITGLFKNEGISFFKCSLNEVDLLVRCGVDKIFIAYPLLLHDARRLFSLMQENDTIEWFVQISHPAHVDILKQAMSAVIPALYYYLDIDVGMHRTGTSPDFALQLYRYAEKVNGLRFAGIHAYDGHNHSADPSERQQIAHESMADLLGCKNRISREGIKVPSVMVGGTPGFLADLKVLSQANPKTTLFVSPGTWIYSDSEHARILDNTFEVAALLLAQVIDLPKEKLATLNIGHKRWSIDQGLPDVFSEAGVRITSFSEEHTVLALPAGKNLNIGDYILMAPRHVCSTVNLWEYGILVDSEGQIKQNIQIDARNR